MEVTLQDIVNDDFLRGIFQEFLRTKLSDELLCFYNEVNEFKRADASQRSVIAKEIYEHYIKPGAPKEIDVSPEMRDVVQQCVNESPNQKLFDYLQLSVGKTLQNIFLQEFLKSEIYIRAITQDPRKKQKDVKLEYDAKVNYLCNVLKIKLHSLELAMLEDKSEPVVISSSILREGVKWLIASSTETFTAMSITINAEQLGINVGVIMNWIEETISRITERVSTDSTKLDNYAWEGITKFLIGFCSVVFRKTKTKFQRKFVGLCQTRMLKFITKFHMAAGTLRTNMVKLAILRAASVNDSAKRPRFQKKWRIPNIDKTGTSPNLGRTSPNLFSKGSSFSVAPSSPLRSNLSEERFEQISSTLLEQRRSSAPLHGTSGDMIYIKRRRRPKLTKSVHSSTMEGDLILSGGLHEVKTTESDPLGNSSSSSRSSEEVIVSPMVKNARSKSSEPLLKHVSSGGDKTEESDADSTNTISPRGCDLSGIKSPISPGVVSPPGRSYAASPSSSIESNPSLSSSISTASSLLDLTCSSESIKKLWSASSEENEQGNIMRSISSPFGPYLVVLPSVSTFSRALTLLDTVSLNRIHPCEFVGLHWEGNRKEKSICPNICESVQRFNVVASSLTHAILSEFTEEARLGKVEYLIRLAFDCLETYHNYNAATMITAAINNNAVQRIKKDWETISSNKPLYEQWQYLLYLTDSAQNYRTYREKIKQDVESDHSVIPFLGVLLRDVTFLEQGNDTFLENGMYNFEKIRMLGQVIGNGLISHQFQKKQIRHVSSPVNKVVMEILGMVGNIKQRIGDDLDQIDTHLYNLSYLIAPLNSEAR